MPTAQDDVLARFLIGRGYKPRHVSLKPEKGQLVSSIRNDSDHTVISTALEPLLRIVRQPCEIWLRESAFSLPLRLSDPLSLQNSRAVNLSFAL